MWKIKCMWKVAFMSLPFVTLAPHEGVAADGGRISGGGDGVFCYDANGNSITSAKLYDFFESDAKGWGLDRQMGAAHINYADKVKIVLDRVKTIDPELALRLRQEWEFFSKNFVLVDAGLIGVPDIDPDVTPGANCKVEQVAVQKKPATPLDKYYLISRRLWTAMDEENKAGLVLHELIYKYALDRFEPSSSRSVRFLNALLASGSGTNKLKTKAYLDILRQIEMYPSVFSSSGLKFDAESLDFSDDGSIASGKLIGTEIQLTKLRSSDSTAAKLLGGSRVAFFPNGHIKSASIAETIILDLNGVKTTFQPGFYEFHNNGMVASFELADAKSVPYQIKGQTVDLWSGATFYPNGFPRTIEVNATEPVHFSQLDNAITLLGSARISFAKNGSIMSIVGDDQLKVEMPIGTFVGYSVDFFEAGGLKKLVGFHEFVFGSNQCKTSFPWILDVRNREGEAEFYENGLPKTIYAPFNRYIWYSACVMGNPIRFDASSDGHADVLTVDFHQNGIIKGGELKSPVPLKFDDGKQHSAAGFINFTEDGLAKCTPTLCS